MKKLNLIIGVVVLFSVVLVSSSFILSNNEEVSTSNNGIGNVVTIDNGQTWVWIADNCNAPYVRSISVRVQKGTNGFWSVDADFQLPEGHCDIPANGAVVKHYSDESMAIINSNGKVNAKIIYQPNDN